MIHFGYLKSTTNNQKPYIDDEWHMLKDKHKMDKMLISILDFELNDDFYLKKKRLNPLDKMHPLGFKCSLEKWIQSGISKENVVEAILLEIHYKFDQIDNMITMLDVIDKETATSFLQNNVTSIIAVICTTHIAKDVPTIWKGFDWDSIVTGLLNAKARFKVVVCICDCNSFKNLFSTVCKSMYVTKMWLEFGQYVVQQEEVSSLSTNLMSDVVFFW